LQSTEAMEILRALIDKVVVTPAADGTLQVELHGEMAALLMTAASSTAPDTARPSSGENGRAVLSVVAGAPSRTPSEPNLAEVLAAIAAADLPKTQRQNLASAVRTVARLLDRPPELLPADPQRLAQRLREISPLAAGLSKGRWAS
jgi:hypothetical protein